MPLIPLLLLAMQAAPPVGERFSILLPRCTAAPGADPREVLVCARDGAGSQRLPMPQLRGPPSGPRPMNPDLKPVVALNGAEARNECGGFGEDCPVALGGQLLPKAIGALADGARALLRARPDRRGRVAIDLDAPPPPGRLLP